MLSARLTVSGDCSLERGQVLIQRRRLKVEEHVVDIGVVCYGFQLTLVQIHIGQFRIDPSLGRGRQTLRRLNCPEIRVLFGVRNALGVKD